MPTGHYENFPVASRLLPRPLREPVAIIYRFARSADDLADEGEASAAERLAGLAAYRDELDRIESGGEPRAALFRDLARIVQLHALPIQPFRDLLDAFSQDVVKTRYANFGELLEYCRRSANPIGRLLLTLFGRTEPGALRESDAICSSLQLINFWQDVALDRDKGRIYLPQDEMRRAGVTEAQLAAGNCDPGWRALLGEQCDRARRMMLSGAPLTDRLTGRVAFEIRVTVQGGLRILEKIEQQGYDVFAFRPVLRAPDWALLIWRAL